MYETVELGSAPADEPCAQVGQDNYLDQALKECILYRQQLQRQHPIPKDAYAFYLTKRFPHDFGYYFEVCLHFDAQNPKAVKFACDLEAALPTTWDEASRAILPV